ncbi:phytanoyl-CoA dioxygenase family protein [Streptomyces beijiangensis]|uniref:Phytanoyl-CoA dioxygenase family protein n=1 Tax=Streptomyces beijiangensis TaxID=163361 RepID=A0A939F1E0_9ACTN|nr:phytanoyl-CoA dioxygenase family protein [Streptomyces beijiangensis]MBO0510415.1 phytanoyl-CoA dioxygenase family protein [Streptomyces beijiangensis]
MPTVLTADEIERFVTDGFVRLPGAFPRSVAEECRAFLWRETGLDPDDPATWQHPVIRLSGYATEPFQRAATTPRLHQAMDQLVGAGRWAPRAGLGTFPIRFPHPDDPGDAGWHLDAGFSPDGETGTWINLRSRGRALLMLFLFSDIDADHGPTRIKVGSHLDVPAFLEPAGERGVEFFTLCRSMDAAGELDSPERPVALATGRAGDVYLCHPFLIHAAQPNRGTVPRFIAQPPLLPTGLLDLDRQDGAYSPVERAVRLGLGTTDDARTY